MDEDEEEDREVRQDELVRSIIRGMHAEIDGDELKVVLGSLAARLAHPGLTETIETNRATAKSVWLYSQAVDEIASFTANEAERKYILGRILTEVVKSLVAVVNGEWLKHRLHETRRK